MCSFLKSTVCYLFYIRHTISTLIFIRRLLWLNLFYSHWIYLFTQLFCEICSLDYNKSTNANLNTRLATESIATRLIKKVLSWCKKVVPTKPPLHVLTQAGKIFNIRPSCSNIRMRLKLLFSIRSMSFIATNAQTEIEHSHCTRWEFLWEEKLKRESVRPIRECSAWERKRVRAATFASWILKRMGA